MKLSREKIVQQAARAGRRTLQLGEEAGGRIRRLSKRSWLILAGIAVLTVGGLWWWLRPEPVKPILPVVQVEPAETDDIELYGEYVGRIRAQQFVEIRARVEGFLEKMLFEEGTYVKKGQPLFIIDPKLYEARVNKAKAQLNKDKALELKADRDLKRIRPLYEQNAASQLDLDNAIASYESATASVAMSEADLTQAETALSYTTVSSPLSGYISERSVDIGTLVGPNGKSLLATVVKSDTVRVDFSMTGLDYLKSKARNVNLGQKDSTRKWDPYITITLADNTQYPLRGLVDFADPQVDPETGTFSVRAEMANPDRILLPGQFTKVRLLLDVRELILRAHPDYSIELLFSNEEEDDDRLITTHGNPYLLNIAFANLIENNCKYSANHSSIVQISFHNRWSIVRMSDNGCGMSAEDKQQLFTLFYRGAKENAVEGHGIGMTLAHKIVKLHEGNIAVHSEKGRGTSFIVELPHV